MLLSSTCKELALSGRQVLNTKPPPFREPETAKSHDPTAEELAADANLVRAYIRRERLAVEKKAKRGAVRVA